MEGQAPVRMFLYARNQRESRLAWEAEVQLKSSPPRTLTNHFTPGLEQEQLQKLGTVTVKVKFDSLLEACQTTCSCFLDN